MSRPYAILLLFVAVLFGVSLALHEHEPQPIPVEHWMPTPGEKKTVTVYYVDPITHPGPHVHVYRRGLQRVKGWDLDCNGISEPKFSAECASSVK